MKPKPELLETLRGLELVATTGTAYRLTSVKYMTSPLSSAGAIKTGGRYNKKGKFAALYLADTPATALAEVQMLRLTDHRLVGVKGPPKVLISVDYALQAVLNLSHHEVQSALGTGLEELQAEWVLKQQQGQPIPTQNLGEAAHELESIEAMWVPSARLAGSLNLVVFPDRLKTGSSLTLYDPDGLLHLTLDGG